MKRIIFCLSLLICVALGAWSQIFYKIEGKGLERPSYLFGTHHYAPVSMLDSLPEVMKGLHASECVVGEIDMTGNPMDMMKAMQSHMMAPADSTLSKLVSPEKFAQMDSVFTSLTGLSLRMFDGMKPTTSQMTLAAMVMSKELPETGQLDTYFQTQAKADSIATTGLETAEFQAEVLFDLIPIQRQMEALIQMLDNPEEIITQTKALNEAYLRRDGEALWQISYEAAKDSEGEFFEILLNRRNEAWLKQLPEMLSERPLFIAVGALHLLGDGGLVKGLTDLGYTLTPVY